MDLKEKLAVLSGAAKYDASCSSSGSSRDNTKGGLGNASMSGICHSWSDDGRCISLLKILQTNICIYDCSYCVNRRSNDVPRASFTPDEVTDLTMNFYKRNYIEGLFLSSAVFMSPDYTMELMLKVVKKLRLVYRFNGYIHLKAIPGSDSRLIDEAGRYADRMSVNIELPSSTSLKLLAPQKTKEAILNPMNYISSRIGEVREERSFYRTSPFLPAGQTTQMIVGATPDHDLSILKLSEGLYKKFHLKRVYYSAYVPVVSGPNLPSINKPPLLREHRLYQADWLLRFYEFGADELLNERNPDFDIDLDPKSDWAIKNINLFPLEINTAEYRMLIRIPGIGVRSAQKIIAARRVRSIDYDALKKFGVVLKRARHFITCRGKYYGEDSMNVKIIRQFLLPRSPRQLPSSTSLQQISIFSIMNDLQSSITGEL